MKPVDSNDKLSDVAVLDRRSVIKKYFPEFLLGHKDYEIYIDLTSLTMGNVTDLIELFSTLQDVDRAPEEFLNDLAKLVGYSFIDELDPQVKRETIQRVFNIYRSRGMKHYLETMATQGGNLGYLGGDVFVPGTYQDRGLAIVSFPREHLFTWNISTWSGKDCYPDSNFHRDGVIKISVEQMYPEAFKRLEHEIKPAGVKVVYDLITLLSKKPLETWLTDNVFVEVTLIPNIFLDTYYDKDCQNNPKEQYCLEKRNVYTELTYFDGQLSIYSPIRHEILSNNGIIPFSSIKNRKITGYIPEIKKTETPKAYSVALGNHNKVVGALSVEVDGKEV